MRGGVPDRLEPRLGHGLKAAAKTGLKGASLVHAPDSGPVHGKLCSQAYKFLSEFGAGIKLDWRTH
jgi:hypothetical protein